MTRGREELRSLSATHPVLHVGDTAGVPTLLRQGLEDIGIRTRSLVPPTRNPLAGLGRKALDGPRRLLEARRGLARIAPSVVHVHYATSALWYLDASPLVVHCHGTDVRGVSGVRSRLLAPAFSRAAMVIVATPDLLGDVPDRARYLPNPVDTDLFAPAPNPTEGEVGDVLVFAAMSEVKGADRLLGIVRQLLANRPELRVTVIDHGDRVAEAVEAGARLVPRREQSELPDLIRGHRVVVGQQLLPSLGTAELQAMACGRPVVGVADSALYGDRLPLERVDGVADAVERVSWLLGDSSTARALGASARSWVVDNHSIGVVSSRLADWYGEIMDAG